MNSVRLNANYKFKDNDTIICTFKELYDLVQQINNKKDVYSTEEILTNKIWMGKNVYRKVVYISSLPNEASEKRYEHHIKNVNDIWIDLSHTFLGTASEHNPGEWIHPDTIRSNFSLSLDGSVTIDSATETDFRINVGRDRSAFSAYVCLEYTKKN